MFYFQIQRLPELYLNIRFVFHVFLINQGRKKSVLKSSGSTKKKKSFIYPLLWLLNELSYKPIQFKASLT